MIVDYTCGFGGMVGDGCGGLTYDRHVGNAITNTRESQIKTLKA
jgi:hypothetical protein